MHSPGWADDSFLVFVTASGERYTASFYSEGRNAFLTELGELLGAAVETGLAHSTDLASRAAWPPELVGEPLFDFVPVKASSWLGELKDWLLQAREMQLTEAVRERFRKLPSAG